MKKILVLALVLAGAVGSAAAQKYLFVDSEKIFKSITAYNNAIDELDNLSKEYQQLVDAKFAAVETLYNNYQAQKGNLSSATREARENAILLKEQEAQQYQQNIFGQEGTLLKKRIELIQPIQERVFKAIAAYAEAGGYDMVIDLAANTTLLYHDKTLDKTEDVIRLVK